MLRSLKWIKSSSQDLVHAILDMPLELSHFPAIFCDEAQDFTRIELELLLELSVYSSRSLSPDDIPRVPFAFAGDPFQTLNPTGFDWNVVGSGFYEKIIDGLNRYGSGKYSVTYEELNYNYRTTQNVVALCNLIQLWRGIIFDIPKLQPQLLWFQDRHAPVNAYFLVDDPIFHTALYEQAELVIILPCHEGEEDEYVQNDPLLSSLAARDDTARNFFSPMTAKGLEFSRVVLYKFGAEYVKDYSHLFHPILHNTPPHNDQKQSLSLQYYLNRLYVGASRPTRRLFIVDTQEGLEQLWCKPELQDYKALIERYNTPGWTSEADPNWKEDYLVAHITPGMPTSFEGDQDKPLDLARILRDAGNNERSPYKLKLASANYRRAGYEQDAIECNAERAVLEQNWSEAAELYLQLGRTEQALQLLWRYRMLAQILRSEFEDRLEHQVAYFLSDSSSVADAYNILNILDESTGNRWQRTKLEHYQQEIIDKALILLTNHPQSNIDWPQFYKDLKRLQISLKFEDTIYMGQLAFIAGSYQDAFEIWKQTSETTASIPEHIQENFRTAELEVVDYPEKLELLRQRGMNDEILALWRSHRTKPSLLEKPQHQEIVWRVLLETENVSLIDDFMTKDQLRTSARMYEAAQFFNTNETHKDEQQAMRFGKGFLKVITERIHFRDNQQLLTHFLRERSAVLTGKQDETYAWSVDYHAISQLAHMPENWREDVQRNSRNNNRNLRELQNALHAYLDAIVHHADLTKFNIMEVGSAVERAVSDKVFVLNFFERVGDNEAEFATHLEQTEARQKWFELKERELEVLQQDKRAHRKAQEEYDSKRKAWGETSDAETTSKRRELTDDQVEAIKMFLKKGWKPERIAENVNGLTINIVKQVIRELKGNE